MRISERDLIKALAAVLAALSLAVQPAHAFETSASEQRGAAPGRALSALPSVAAPDLGVDKSLREIWRGFSLSYKSGDKQAALKQLQAGVGRGDILAQWKLGRMYADGDGVPQDDYQAFLLFSRIADARGDESRESMHAGVVAEAFVALGAYWLEGIPQSPVKANPLHAAKAFNYAATYYGHPEAQYQLARMLLDGSATGQAEPRLALRWLNHAAEKRHVQAQAVLGRMLLLGEATQRQSLRGLMWLQVARENATLARDGWVVDLHRKAFEAASEDDRREAVAQAERFLKAAERR